MSPQENEILRHAVMEVLVPRHPTALPMRAIRRRIETEALVDFPYDDPALVAALEFLRGLEQVRFVPDALGSTAYWTATSSGILAHERGSR